MSQAYRFRYVFVLIGAIAATVAATVIITTVTVTVAVPMTTTVIVVPAVADIVVDSRETQNRLQLPQPIIPGDQTLHYPPVEYRSVDSYTHWS